MNSTERKGRVHESRRTERRSMILYALGDSLPFCFSLVSSCACPVLSSYLLFIFYPGSICLILLLVVDPSIPYSSCSHPASNGRYADQPEARHNTLDLEPTGAKQSMLSQLGTWLYVIIDICVCTTTTGSRRSRSI